MTAETPSSWLVRLRNSAMMYALLGTFARFAANVLLVPLFLIFFTPGEQAVWWVFYALGGLANLADFGFGAMITRVYSFLWAGAEDVEHEGLKPLTGTREPNLPRMHVLNVTVRRLYLWIALIATVVLLVAGSLLLLKPIREAGGSPTLWAAWLTYALMIGYGVGTGHWVLACQGINLVRDSQAALFWGAMAYLVTGAILLTSRVGLLAMVIAAGVRGVVIREICRRAYQRTIVRTPGMADVPDRALLKKLWPNARKFGFLSVGGWLVANASLIVCSQTQTAAVTASFGLSAQVGAFVVALATLWLTTKWPAITILRAQGSTAEMSAVFARRLGYCVLSYIGMAVLLVLFGNRFLNLWGARSQLFSAALLVVYLWYLLQQLVYVQFAGLAFTGNVVPLYGLNLFVADFCLPPSTPIQLNYYRLFGEALPIYLHKAMKLIPSILLSSLACVFSTLADVKLPSIFSDHMVLQREVAAVPVWGKAEPGEEVTVSIDGQTKTVTAGADGKWMVKLANLKAGGPHALTVKGKNTVTVNDVLIGEVWLGSGQSNMAFTVNKANNFEQEQAAAKQPQIRMFIVHSGAADTAQDDCKGEWQVCAPETVGGFSAALFFFGRDVYKSLNVPMGLINSSVGGTPIESWIDAATQKSQPELKGFFGTKEEPTEAALAAAKRKYERDLAKWKEDAKQAKASGKKAGRAPQDPDATRARKGNVGGLFNGKIAPLIPYAIRGALWYQGEANSAGNKPPYYHAQLSLLVKDWRARWGEGDFPFAWVQLPNFTRAGDGWMLVREAMLQTLAVPNTGMAITVDIGDPKNIHPTNKQEVGRRLSLWALGTVYHQNVPTTSGPLPAGHELAGSEVKLSFKHVDGGLVAKGGDLKGFVVAGEDKQWKPATAKIVGDKVVVSSPDVTKPVAARYAWQDNPDCNLYNGAGLPASPFRTDNW